MPALDRGLGLGVDRARRLVEHEDRGTVGERPGEREDLSLAGREVRAPLPDLRLVAGGQALDEAVGLDRAGRAVDRELIEVAAAERDVARERAAEKEDVLEHGRDPPAQRLLRKRAHVDAVDPHAAAVDVVEPRQQLDDRRLSRLPSPRRRRPSRRARPGRRRRAGSSRRRPARTRTSDRRRAAVAEPDVLELDAAPRRRIRRRDSAARSRTPGSVSRSWKIRSLLAIADCMTEYLAERSRSGMKKRCM